MVEIVTIAGKKYVSGVNGVNLLGENDSFLLKNQVARGPDPGLDFLNQSRITEPGTTTTATNTSGEVTLEDPFADSTTSVTNTANTTSGTIAKYAPYGIAALVAYLIFK